MDINDLFDGIANAFRQYAEETGMSLSGREGNSDAKIQRTEKIISGEIEVNRPAGGNSQKGQSEQRIS